MRTYARYGEKIKRIRRERDVSQEQLAEQASVDPKTIIQIEKGKRNPTLKTLQKIANALKMPVEHLLKNS